MLTELNPKPDQVTIAVGTTQMNILDLTTPDDVQGTQLANPAMQAAYQNMVADATPEFYIEHLKRLRKNAIQPMFAMAHIHTLEAIEHLIRTGVYMGPLNHTMTAIGGAGGCGRNPYDFMEWVRRSPHGSVATYESLWRTVAPYAAMAVALGIHIRVGIEDNMWLRKGMRMTSVQQVEQVVRIAKELGRKVATGDEARQILKIGTWYNSPDETLATLRPPAQPQGWPTGVHREGDRRTTASAGRRIRWAPDSGAVCYQVAGPSGMGKRLEAVEDMIARIWTNLIGRIWRTADFSIDRSAAVAAIFAIRAGLRDAREGRAPYGWAVLTDPTNRREFLRDG